MVSTILFDIGGVFLRQSDRKMHAIANMCGVTFQEVNAILYEEKLWDEHKRGRLSEDDYWMQVVLQLNFHEPWQMLRDDVEMAVELDMQLVALAKDLRCNFRLAALSNAGAELERRLAHFQLMGLFDNVINSHRVGMAKPDRQIYAYTAQLLGVEPKEVLFVDDKLRNTCVAESMGFQTHVYTDVEQFAVFLLQTGIVTDTEQGA